MSYAIADAATMLRRDFKHALRYPAVSLSGIMVPLIFLLLFVYVFGGAIGVGIGGEGSYVNYVVPGIILMCVSSAAQQTAIGAASDMSEGIIARFRTMPISRASVLTAHAVGTVIRTSITIALIIGLALIMGFSPSASVGEWFAVVGVLLLFVTMVSWLGVALGLKAKNAEGANGSSLPVVFLPFISSAFVPSDKMPSAVAWFVENQPYTPMIETVRGLLLGTPIGNNGWIAAIWAVALSAVGYFWAKKLYNRDPQH